MQLVGGKGGSGRAGERTDEVNSWSGLEGPVVAVGWEAIDVPSCLGREATGDLSVKGCGRVGGGSPSGMTPALGRGGGRSQNRTTQEHTPAQPGTPPVPATRNAQPPSPERSSN